MKLILLVSCVWLSLPLRLKINSEILTVYLDAPSYALNRNRQHTRKQP
jgi:hypothetical protein